MAMLFFTLAAALAALIVGVLFVTAWRDKDVLLTVTLGVVLFSLLVLAMLAVRVWL